MRKKGLHHHYWKWFPIGVMLLCMLIYFFKGRSISWQELSSIMPEKTWQAVLLFWICYAVKSLSVFFPLLVLYAAAGQFFSLPIALFVNLTGLIICETLPYLIGKFFGTDLATKLCRKYPKLSVMEEVLHQRGSLAFATLSRAVGVVPGDLASLYFGAIKLPYIPYLLGSLLGLLPRMVADTLIGKGLGGTRSPELLIAYGISAFIVIISIFICRRLLKETINRRKEQDDENSNRNRQQ